MCCFRSEDDTLFVRNNVSLKKLVADPLFAVVFVLDYLVGVKAYDVSTLNFILHCPISWN